MKAQFLKIAGVKSEKAFYKKYPTQEAFFKAHPEAKSIKKAQIGSDMNNNGIPDYLEMSSYNQVYGPQNQWNFGNGWTPSSSPFNTPNAQQTGNNSFQHSNPFGMQNYGQQWAQNNPMPTKNPNSKFSNSSFGSNSGGTQNQGIGGQGIMGAFSGAVEGIKKLNAEKEMTKHLQTWAKVSDVEKKAAISNAFVPKQQNEWYRPDDLKNIFAANEQYNTKGRGTDVLSSQNGSFVGGNPTEIQNTYSPEHTLFDDLGYLPIENEQDIKSYQGGGSWLGQANSAISGSGDTSFGGNFGQGSQYDSMIGGAFGNNAGSQVGSSIGSVFGPVGSLVGTAVGGYLDKEPGKQRNALNKINSNNAYIGRISTGRDITSTLSNMGVGQNGNYIDTYEEGGYMNPEYNPQVITMFGDHTAEDFADYAHKYRAGGHLKEYTEPSKRAMETYAMGGKIQTHWGGDIEDVSHNPYMPGSGVTSMIKGASHKDGGVGISYGTQNGYASNGADIEAEGGEPIVEITESGENINSPELKAVVVGNIPLSTKMANATGDEDLIRLAKDNNGASLKKIFAKRTLQEVKANKYKQKASDIANNADNSKYGQLDLSTAQIMDHAGDKTLELIAKEKMKMVNYQDTLHKIKDEVSKARGKNISAEALGRGQIKDDLDPITKDAPLSKIQNGTYSIKSNNPGYIDYNTPDVAGGIFSGINYDTQWGPKRDAAFSNPEIAKKLIKDLENYSGQDADDVKAVLAKQKTMSGKIEKAYELASDKKVGPYHSILNSIIDKNISTSSENKPIPSDVTTKNDNTSDKKQIDVVPLKQNNIADVMGLMSQLFQNKNFPAMDPRQFAGEYVALAQNTPEPVPTQHAYAELDPITRMSYQDVRNANTADFRDVERNLRFNPAALADIYSKKALANQQGYGEEFRTNQALEQQIYGGNRAKMAQNQATNLALNLDQAAKQSLRDSKTKEIAQKSIASMADKVMKYTADKNKFLTASNLFPNYGYGANYKTQMQGPGFKPVIPQIYGNKSSIQQVPVYKDGVLDHYEMIEGDGGTDNTLAPYQTPPFVATSKNGGKIKKNQKNSSIVRAYKNL